MEKATNSVRIADQLQVRGVEKKSSPHSLNGLDSSLELQELQRTKTNMTVQTYESMAELTNYKPISVLSPLSKIFEMCVKNKLLPYFEDSDFFSNVQHGFFRNKSAHIAGIESTDCTVGSLLTSSEIFGHC